MNKTIKKSHIILEKSFYIIENVSLNSIGLAVFTEAKACEW